MNTVLIRYYYYCTISEIWSISRRLH